MVLGPTVVDRQRKGPGAVVLGRECPCLVPFLEMGVGGSFDTVVGVDLEGGGDGPMWIILVFERVIERIKDLGCGPERFAVFVLWSDGTDDQLGAPPILTAMGPSILSAAFAGGVLAAAVLVSWLASMGGHVTMSLVSVKVLRCSSDMS